MIVQLRVIQICLMLFCASTLFSQSSMPVYHASSSRFSLATFSLNVHPLDSGLNDRTLNLARAALKHLSAVQLASFFSDKRLREDQILSNPSLYSRAAFIKVAKQLPSYPEYVEYYHEQYQSLSVFKKMVGKLTGSYSQCRAARFARLYAGCQATLHKRREQTRALYAQLQEKHFRQEGIHALAVRQNALAQTHAEGYTRTLYTIQLSDTVVRFAQGYGIERALLEHGMMTAYEKQLHTEFIEQLTQAYRLSEAYHKIPATPSWVEMIVKSVWSGLQANAKKHVHETTLWASCGWYALDIARAALEGVLQSGKNTLDLMIHPIESVKAIAHGLGSMIMLAGRAVMPLAELHCLREAGRDEQADEAYARLKQNSTVVLKYCKQELKKVGLRDVVKQGTAIAADIVISGKLLKAASNICRHAKVVSKKMLTQLKREEAAVAYAHGGAEKLLMESAEYITPHKPNLPAVSSVGGTAHTGLEALQQLEISLMKSLEPEIARLRLLFDNRYKGFAEFSNKYIKLSYEHFLGMELTFSKRGIPQIGGFHHDFMNHVEKSGIFEFANKVMTREGFYKADVFYKGNFVKNITFFPADWPREKVVRTVFDIYERAVKSENVLLKNLQGKYTIVESITDEIELVMHITPKGRMVTVYPDF